MAFSAHRWANIISGCDIFESRVQYEVAQYKCVSFYTVLCAQKEILDCPTEYLFFSSAPPTVIPNLCLLKLPESLPGGSADGPLRVGLFSDDT